jgi:hypothetical protein
MEHLDPQIWRWIEVVFTVLAAANAWFIKGLVGELKKNTTTLEGFKSILAVMDSQFKNMQQDIKIIYQRIDDINDIKRHLAVMEVQIRDLQRSKRNGIDQG